MVFGVGYGFVSHTHYERLLAFQQVAATGEENEIVGMIRGCIKTVTCGQKLSRAPPNPKTHHHHHSTNHHLPVFTKLAYILGLRVSPAHRSVFIYLFIYLFIIIIFFAT